MLYIDDHIQNSLARVNRSLTPISFLHEDRSTTIKFKCLRWLSLFNFIVVDGQLMFISSMDLETNRVEVFGTYDETNHFEIPDAPLFVGSRMVSSSEWLLYSNDYREKIPFLWLNFPANISKITNGNDFYFERWTGLRLFFVADSDRSQWISKQTLEYRTKVISIWISAFKKAIRFPYEFDGEVTEFAHPIFGVEQTDGTVSDIFNGNLSAVSIDFDLFVLDVECVQGC